jgi:hypothetical protein
MGKLRGRDDELLAKGFRLEIPNVGPGLAWANADLASGIGPTTMGKDMNKFMVQRPLRCTELSPDNVAGSVSIPPKGQL